MTIELTVPALLADCIGGATSTTFDAITIAGALSRLHTQFPLLIPHVYDDVGQIRKHILVYYNSDSVTWLDDLNRPVQAGDRLQIIQAVSGG